MTDNKKPVAGGTGTGFKTTSDSQYFTTEDDPLKGWFGLAINVRPSRNRQPKRGWGRGRR
ncbi:hypothetical protein [Candidatus Accumulibacter sp. ACC012]|uniref:hypothetical protein n=1 Tax=Candidatus Accumulibacter sp. ACC012 TaxID=2823332 RepID=UPI0025C3EE60|nr:hypothetical protein [Candidatus Accumulibacter sp. ACC012]